MVRFYLSTSHYSVYLTNTDQHYCSGQDAYTASDYLPRTLVDPVKGSSYAVDVTPFQEAVGTRDSRWAWLEEKPKIKDLVEGLNGSDSTKCAYPGAYGSELQQLLGALSDGADDQSLVSRPEHGVFSLAMVGGGRVFGEAHLYGQSGDYRAPWRELIGSSQISLGLL